MQNEKQKQEKIDRDAKIKEMHQAGLSRGEIARQIGVSRTCVSRSLNGDQLPQRRSEYSAHYKNKMDDWKADWDKTCAKLRKTSTTGEEKK